jgi:hypothetical protein
VVVLGGGGATVVTGVLELPDEEIVLGAGDEIVSATGAGVGGATGAGAGV